MPKPSRELRDLLRGESDIVITQTRFFATSLLGAIYAKLHKIPLIHTERGSYHSITSNKAVSLLARIYDHTVGSVVVKSAIANVGVSQAACDLIKHIGGNHAKVIHNGIDFHIKSDDYLNDICFIGRLIYAKGVQDLITAFENCCDKHNNMRLIIVGDGNYKNTLEKQARKSRHQSRIVFYGTQNHENVMRILAKCDIFVNPSYSEGLPTAVMEAASLGKPIIATDVGGTNEIITDGESGILYPPRDVNRLTEALVSLTGNLTKARQMGINALSRARAEFNWDEIINQYEEILKEVVKK